MESPIVIRVDLPRLGVPLVLACHLDAVATGKRWEALNALNDAARRTGGELSCVSAELKTAVFNIKNPIERGWAVGAGARCGYMEVDAPYLLIFS